MRLATALSAEGGIRYGLHFRENGLAGGGLGFGRTHDQPNGTPAIAMLAAVPGVGSSAFVAQFAAGNQADTQTFGRGQAGRVSDDFSTVLGG